MVKLIEKDALYMDEEGTRKRMKLTRDILLNEFEYLSNDVRSITAFVDCTYARDAYCVTYHDDDTKTICVRSTYDAEHSKPFEEVVAKAKQHKIFKNDFVSYQDIFSIFHEIGHLYNDIPFDEYEKDLNRIKNKYKNDKEALHLAYRTEIADERLADEFAIKCMENNSLIKRINGYIKNIMKGE